MPAPEGRADDRGRPEAIDTPPNSNRLPAGFVERAVDTWMNDLEAADGASTTLTSDQLVTRLVTWLMKGLHA
jgi:hypothetical protein